MKINKKKAIIEQLRKTPIIQLSCEKMGIGRATFYRWRKKDKKFNVEVELAIEEGSNLVNDMAESQLIKAIKDGDMRSIIFWLKNHHKKYSPKLEVTTKDVDPPLSDEQKEIIQRSLNMAFGMEEPNNESTGE